MAKSDQKYVVTFDESFNAPDGKVYSSAWGVVSNIERFGKRWFCIGEGEFAFLVRPDSVTGMIASTDEPKLYFYANSKRVNIYIGKKVESPESGTLHSVVMKYLDSKYSKSELKVVFEKVIGVYDDEAQAKSIADQVNDQRNQELIDNGILRQGQVLEVCEVNLVSYNHYFESSWKK